MPIFSKIKEHKLFIATRNKIKSVPLLSSWKTIIFFGISAILVYYILTRLDFIFFWESLKKLSFLEFVWLFALSCFEFFLVSMRNNLVGGFGIFSHFLDYTSSTTIEKIVPPRPLGIYYRFLVTKTLYKTEVAKTIFIMFVDSALDLIYSLFGILALIFVPNVDFSLEFIFYIIAIAGAVYIVYVFYQNYSYAKRSKVLGKIFDYIKGLFLKLKKSLLEFLQVKTATLVISVLLTLLRFVVNVLKVYFLFAIFGVDVSFWSSLIIYSIAYLVGSSSSLPGGIGAFELTFLYVAKTMGIEESIALTVAILERIFCVWIWALITGAHLTNKKVGLFSTENRFVAKVAQLAVKMSEKSKTHRFMKRVYKRIRKKIKAKKKRKKL